jgi:hypothetical protein
MKNLSTGTGLCIAGLCVVAFPFAQKLASVDSQAHAGVQASAMAVVASSATAQVTPTIVWYGTGSTSYRDNNSDHWLATNISRAWSDGRVESRWIRKKIQAYPTNDVFCSDLPGCSTGWVVASDPNQGFNAASDVNFDAKVDGADLGQLLADWGDAPRQDIPPSDCPLNLVNP